ncbi:hypothetical protein AFM11_34250 [Mycolicibacterium wolinskyi]|uniref:Uncharacterized protein n=1 Tax=Mycolicibacterium wolinskyi TaxID=59750 RepID=A0A132PBK4_9MYCO|nr:hypothetical protein AFM11_34250 [Mycolicibacterium wolinskyi]
MSEVRCRAAIVDQWNDIFLVGVSASACLALTEIAVLGERPLIVLGISRTGRHERYLATTGSACPSKWKLARPSGGGTPWRDEPSPGDRAEIPAPSTMRTWMTHPSTASGNTGEDDLDDVLYRGG